MNILVFAPHPDDEILGVGGVMAREISRGNKVFVCIVTRGKPPIFEVSAEEANLPHNHYYEIKSAHDLLGITKTFFLQYPAAMLETAPRYELNQSILDVINEVNPEVVYMPHFGDMQKDHELTTNAIMIAVRPKGNHHINKVYSYETLSETEWNIPHNKNVFIPNTYINIDGFLKQKLQAMKCYQSQLEVFPNPRSLEAIEALAKVRGSTAGFGAAEAFMLIREYRY